MEESFDYEFIFVKPEFIDHWSYQIDSGKPHLMREDEVYPYVKSFLRDSKEWAKVVDIIRRHQPFLVSVKTKTCKELHPSFETREDHRKLISQDISEMMNNLDGEGVILNTNKRYSLVSRKNEDSVDRSLKNWIRRDINTTLPDTILQRRLK